MHSRLAHLRIVGDLTEGFGGGIEEGLNFDRMDFEERLLGLDFDVMDLKEKNWRGFWEN